LREAVLVELILSNASATWFALGSEPLGDIDLISSLPHRIWRDMVPA
jgi:hypothetical protein